MISASSASLRCRNRSKLFTAETQSTPRMAQRTKRSMPVIKPTLAIVDWGIGGISIYKLLSSSNVKVPVIYFSDTGVTPYGKMTREELVSRLNLVIDFLASEGATHLVIGCNAASTVIPFLETRKLKVAGVIESAVSMTSRLRPRKLALIGGRRTVLSGVYKRAFADRGINVVQRIAQPLSASIESGDVSSAKLRKHCRNILGPIRNCSHLLLACTHYPAIVPVLKEFVSEDTVIIDPAGELIGKVKRWNLNDESRNGTRAGSVSDRFLTSGDPEKMKAAAFRAFGVKIAAIETVGL